MLLNGLGKQRVHFLLHLGGMDVLLVKMNLLVHFWSVFLIPEREWHPAVIIFLVFGGNVEENSPVVKRYINSVCKQIVDLESTIFEINGLHVRFHFEELPNDMKMLAMLGGWRAQ